MKKTFYVFVVLTIMLMSCQNVCKKNPKKTSSLIVNNSDWNDTDGNPIFAHDGGISKFNKIYYWYGSNYNNNPNGLYGVTSTKEKVNNGFNVYSSTDLVNWKYEGIAMSVLDSSKGYTGSSHRPHVIYNNKTKKYVMWFFHFRDAYPDIMSTVAVSDSPIGPFEVIGIKKTGSPKILGAKVETKEQKSTGPEGCSQDINIFQDDDGSAYIVYDDGLRNIRVDKLTDDYLASTKQTVIALPAGQERHEAPAMIKYKGKYIVAGSGVVGWGPSPTHYATADTPMGPYSEKKQLTPRANINTWNSQITDFVYIKESDILFAMCDQWWIPDANVINKSRYLWLPITNNKDNGEFILEYQDSWNPFIKN